MTAASVLIVRISTTACWNDAATSATDASGCASRYTRTAVFNPEKLKSESPLSIIGRGNAIAFGFPSSAIFDTAGPPGYPSPRSFATLSNASPAASSRVAPPRSDWPWPRLKTISACPPPRPAPPRAGAPPPPAARAPRLEQQRENHVHVLARRHLRHHAAVLRV